MNHIKIAKQLSGFFKTTFDHGFDTITMLQDYTGKTITLSLVRSPWFPEEGRKLVSEWLKANRKGFDDFKVAANEQYRKLEMLFHQDNGADSVATPEKTDKDQGAQKTKKDK